MKSAFLPILALIFFSCSDGQTNETNNMENNDMKPVEQASEEPTTPTAKYVYVKMETSMGDVTLELDSTNAPQTVNNFLSYVDEGFFEGTIFHRVMNDFMIQGGGFSVDGVQKTTKDPIFLESQNGLRNDVGTIAMARTNAPNSATAQFFINLKNNDFLNYAPGNPGYAVFGKVASGMEVVNEIRMVKTGRFQQHSDWPVEPVIIHSIKRE